MIGLREGDERRNVSQVQFIASEFMTRSDNFQDRVLEQFRSGFARMQHVNAKGETLYLDVDTVEREQITREEDFARNGMKIRIDASAVFRLPRRSDLIECELDLLAYDIGSSFLREDGLVSVLTDPTYAYPRLDVIATRDISRLLVSRGFPLVPLWQPDLPMTRDEVLSGGYDSDGVPALHKVRVEDNLSMPLYGGAL